ncbi:hypothetical protein LJK88_23235 [Paenibacillus sp. P26]|nr:hypothetical protein LJK88_23235 [Paenibacillus sp. P26]
MRSSPSWRRLLEEGARQGEIRRDLPARTLASLFLSWLEGALMMAGIRKDASALLEERNALLGMLKASPQSTHSALPG